MSATQQCRGHAGFSLIELMVAVVIGMLAILVIMQMFISSDFNKRQTAGGDDAQINGTIALYGLERDIRSSGYGINSYQLLGCALTYTSADSASVTINPLAPVVINPPTSLIPAGDANTDTILVAYGNSSGSAEGDALTATSTVGQYTVTTPSSFNLNDKLVAEAATRPSPCALTIDQVTSISGATVTVTPGIAGMAVGSIIFNLGQNLVVKAYAIRNGALTVCDYTAYNCGNSAYLTGANASSVWVPVASNIVSMRAQYGQDTTNIAASTMTGVVTTYDQTTPGSSADASGLLVQCGWARTLTVRIAIVARNAGYDKNTPTTATPTWTGSTVSTATPTNPTAISLDLSANNTNWKNYRYKTLETTIPLRNTIWQGSQANYMGGGPGC